MCESAIVTKLTSSELSASSFLHSTRALAVWGGLSRSFLCNNQKKKSTTRATASATANGGACTTDHATANAGARAAAGAAAHATV